MRQCGTIDYNVKKGAIINVAITNISFKTEDVIKTQAREIFSRFGLDMTSGLNLLLHAVVREEGISFAVDTKPSAEYASWMRAKLEEALERRKNPNRRVFSEEEVIAKYRSADV